MVLPVTLACISVGARFEFLFLRYRVLNARFYYTAARALPALSTDFFSGRVKSLQSF
jgi:hypothetical protein